jgi:hypothetical protein
MSYAKDMVRLDDPGTDIGSLCYWACSSVLLVLTKGGIPRDTRAVTSYTGVDKDMTSMHTVKHGEWREDEGDQQSFPSREEGPKLISFESPRWRPKDNSSSSPPYLGVQEQHAQKMTPRSHTESILDVLYMDGKIISRSFQWNWLQTQIR